MFPQTTRIGNVPKRKKEQQPILRLHVSDLSRWDGQITTTIFNAYFYSLENAKQHAELDYAKRIKASAPIPFRWKVKGNKWSSGDLGFIMYEIDELKIL